MKKSPRDLRSPPAEAFGSRRFLGLSCPELPLRWAESPDRRRMVRLAAPFRLRRPGSAVRPCGRSAVPVDLPRASRLSVGPGRRTTAGPSRDVPAGRWLSLAAFACVENSLRLSDLAASPPCRCSRCAWILRWTFPPSVGAPGASSGLSSRSLGPLGALRNVSAAPTRVKPTFLQVSGHNRRSKGRDKERQKVCAGAVTDGRQITPRERRRDRREALRSP